MNKDVWDALSDSTKATIDMACTAGTFRALTRGESLQGDVMASFPAKGVTARTLNPELLQALNTLLPK